MMSNRLKVWERSPAWLLLSEGASKFPNNGAVFMYPRSLHDEPTNPRYQITQTGTVSNRRYVIAERRELT